MTKTFAIASDVTLTTSNPVLIEVMSALQTINASIAIIRVAPYESKEFTEAYHAAEKLLYGVDSLMHKCSVVKAYKAYEALVSDAFWDFDAVYDRAYRNYAMADFREYESHMNEPDFDWSFYSDWHKDIFGYRPR